MVIRPSIGPCGCPVWGGGGGGGITTTGRLGGKSVVGAPPPALPTNPSGVRRTDPGEVGLKLQAPGCSVCSGDGRWTFWGPYSRVY